MNENSMLAILDAREDRYNKQIEMINEFNMPLISFLLNIPGLVKSNDLFDEVFNIGVNFIENKLIENNIIFRKRQINNFVLGKVQLFSCCSNASMLKKISVEIEERHSLGRLFDIDVIKTDGQIISRRDFGILPRKCFICEKDAHLCTRNKTHSLEEINKVIYKKIDDFFINRN